MLPRPPSSTLFPYTTLFRSVDRYPDNVAVSPDDLEASRSVVGHGGSRDGAGPLSAPSQGVSRSEEHTSELQSHHDLVCRLLLEKKKMHNCNNVIYKSIYPLI